jgi:hypothetical protein
MKLSLSTDYSSPRHWERVVEFAERHGVSRLVFWGRFGEYGFLTPFLYPKYAGLLPEERQQAVGQLRHWMRHAAELTTDAGMEFWCIFQVLQVPRPCDETTRKLVPGLFNEASEPDMGGEAVYQYIRDQLYELLCLIPGLAGVELWVMECADVKIAHLTHQRLTTGEICSRIVDTVHSYLTANGRKMVQELHTAGGDPATRHGLYSAAARHPEVILSADNVIGDFHLHLPFNEYLVHASKTNPVQVHFDLNGEYWGRNFVPTSALDQYAEHIEIARSIGAAYLDGRLSTGHDDWSGHANILPSRRRFYPALETVNDSAPVPKKLEVCCTDTLGGFNAEFFCRRAHDPNVRPEDVVREFLVREFGGRAGELVPAFMRLQGTLGKIFFVDRNYYGAQSVLPTERLITYHAHDVLLTLPPGTPVPTREMMSECDGKRRAVFQGWPTPLGHECAGREAMIREKQEAFSEAEALRNEVRAAAQSLKAEDRNFIVRQFEDLVFFAGAFRFLLEGHAQYFLLKKFPASRDDTNFIRFHVCLAKARQIASGWELRYAGGRYLLAEQLRLWEREFECFLAKLSSPPCS